MKIPPLLTVNIFLSGGNYGSQVVSHNSILVQVPVDYLFLVHYIKEIAGTGDLQYNGEKNCDFAEFGMCLY